MQTEIKKFFTVQPQVELYQNSYVGLTHLNNVTQGYEYSQRIGIVLAGLGLQSVIRFTPSPLFSTTQPVQDEYYSIPSIIVRVALVLDRVASASSDLPTLEDIFYVPPAGTLVVTAPPNPIYAQRFTFLSDQLVVNPALYIGQTNCELPPLPDPCIVNRKFYIKSNYQKEVSTQMVSTNALYLVVYTDVAPASSVPLIGNGYTHNWTFSSFSTYTFTE